MIDIDKVEVKSFKIQNMLQSIPGLLPNLKFFFYLSKEVKCKILSPLSCCLSDYSLSEDDVINVLDKYSRNIYLDNIDKECERIIFWLLSKQNTDNGSWPLAGDPKSSYRENAWATAVCILSLIKFKNYKNLADTTYDDKISNGIKWFFNTDNKLYNPRHGWNNPLSGNGSINLYDTGIAVTAISKYKECYNENPIVMSHVNDVVEIINNLLVTSDNSPFWALLDNKPDIGLTSFMAMTLIHFYREFKDIITNDLTLMLERTIFQNIKWIIREYNNNYGCTPDEKAFLEKSCYSIQVLNKFRNHSKNNLQSIPQEEVDKLSVDIMKILRPEIARIESCFTYKDNLWGWPKECGGLNIKIYNTSLATSTLLKCSFNENILIDFSIILRAINTLLEKYNWDNVTLDNTYILCTVVDYLRYRTQSNSI
jgi:hypothetical protein